MFEQLSKSKVKWVKGEARRRKKRPWKIYRKKEKNEENAQKRHKKERIDEKNY